MKIAKITFTGADDKTDQSRLSSISNQYPQVEWAILFSRNKGQPLYPTWEWIERLARENKGMSLAAHLCGKYVRDLLAGDFDIMGQGWAKAFRRIQVNFYRKKVTETEAENFMTKLVFFDKQHDWILQMDGVNNELYVDAPLYKVRTFPLFDLSGGDGVTPDKWPAPVGTFCGYAGGLGPHNLAQQLMKLEEVVPTDNPIWIDMQTHVRNESNEFDLAKVRQCIEIVRPYLIGS